MPCCQGCSAVIAFMIGTLCGLCQRKTAAPDNVRVPTPQTPQIPVPENRPPLINIGNGNPTETQELMRARIQARAAKDMVNNTPSSVPGKRSIFFHMVPVAPNPEAVRVMGVASRHFDETESFQDCIDILTDRWSSEWGKRCSERLTKKHLVLHFLKGETFMPDSDIGTVAEFYDAHQRLPNSHRDKCFALPPKMKIPGLYIYLEALILVEEFERDNRCVVPYFIVKPKAQKSHGGRAQFDNNDEEVMQSVKRPRTEIALRSSVPPLTSSFRPNIFQDIQVLFAKSAVDAKGQVTIGVPDMNAEQPTEPVSISTEILSQGESQYVYKGLYKGQLYAFKRFKNVGEGKNNVSLTQNQDQVVLEAKRLLRLGWFNSSFEMCAQECNVAIEATRVTEVLIAFEMTPQDKDPSTACGYRDYDITLEDTPMVWLMEPFRPGNSEKWSGTNQHPSHTDSALGSTINAFAHFVYEASFGTIAVADIQTSRGRVGNKAFDILFDLTTHTTSGTYITPPIGMDTPSRCPF
ncbi:hypothetical protein FB45DRAFT_1022309 [Roridomyces roridus]|uniref:Alpha-type protein kinase domain-containing protein n=1 Tax=Roridomyces roridus TaxID=1738132 RepID=A0AAD7FWC5_9AGAR|nr:hypothetical protein FB45DRAFT_1022309 [Roridomyces roridus]